MEIKRNGNKFFKGNIDLCEMLENQNSDAFASFRIDGAQMMCPVKPVIETISKLI